MGNACPGKCAAGNQRPLAPLELSTLSNTVGETLHFYEVQLCCVRVVAVLM